jgi:Ran GTPase-activating protein (RanGAP) involved in mRNA processing and transport
MNYSGLAFLCLWMCPMENKTLEALAKFVSSHQTLTVLHIIDCKVTAKTSTHLAFIARNSKSLTTLVVDHNPIGSQGITTLVQGLRENKVGSVLSKCSFRFCDIDSDGGEAIATILATNNVITYVK